MTASRTVALGYAVGSGEPVAIPIRNMCVAGQTQEAGKTTALEALITRSQLRAVTFITKRGESSFQTARRVAPYFREQTDWQFVASVLEASRGEKLKFERPWIIRASKGARTLADVQRNVRRAMADPKTRGLAADVYLTLDAYLDVVVPAIAAVAWAPRLELGAGVNAIDVTAVPVELQHLVIRSCVDWVLEREQDTIVVVPEAWKFVPEGRNTPVKRAADALIRQGSGMRDYVWLDSQDLGGVSKEILRHCPVWLLGVQRESNEIKRTLANIPAGVAKPSAGTIATLALGEFVACWGTHAIRTYVQPAWMPDELACKVATGALDVGNASAIASAANVAHAARAVFGRPMTSVGEIARALTTTTVREDAVTKDEAARLTRENEQLKADNAELRQRLVALEKGRHGKSEESAGRGRVLDARGVDASRPDGVRAAADRTSAPTGRGAGHPDFSQESETFYQAIKARLIAEAPAVLRATIATPELEITRTRPVLTFEEHSMKWRLVRLLAEGFFVDPKGPSAIRSALKRTGPDANTANIARAMDDLVKAGVFTDEGSGYRAVPGLVVRQGEA